MTSIIHLPNDPTTIDRLDALLDTLALGQAPSVPPDDTLSATAISLHSACIAPDPDPAFAASLRANLLSPSPQEHPFRRTLARAGCIARRGFLPTGRWLPAASFSTMILIVLVLLGTLTGGDQAVTRFLGLTQNPPPDPDVPLFRNDPAGAAEQPGPAPSVRPEVRWEFRTGARFALSPVLADGTIYLGSGGHYLFAIDATTGTERWRFDAGAKTWGTTVAEGTVYFVTGLGHLFAVDAATGTKKWEQNLYAYLLRPPTVVDGTIYLNSGEHASNYPAVVDGVVYAGGGPSVSSPGSPGSTLYAIDAATGRERWRLSTGDADAVYAVDAATGQERWRTPVDGAPWGPPAVAGGLVYLSLGYNGPLIALDATTGAERWRYNGSAGYGPVVVDGTLYGGNFALDARTGRERWRIKDAEPIQSPPAVIHDTAYFASEWGTIYAVDVKTGTARWGVKLGEHIVSVSDPIVSGGFIYLGASDGTLYALGDPLPNVPDAVTTRDVPSPDECTTPPIAPDHVADYMSAGSLHSQTAPEPFVWPVGQPADTTTTAAITDAHRQLVACINAGNDLAVIPLFTRDFWLRRAADGSYPSTFFIDSSAPRQRPPTDRVAILSITDIQTLPDGRVAAQTALETGSDLPARRITTSLIFANDAGHWLIDEAATVSETSGPQTPPSVATPATPSATEPQLPFTPGPELCRVAAADTRSLVATANASYPNPMEAPTSTPVIPIEPVAPADDPTNDAATRTVLEWVACMNAGSPTRQAALFNPEALTRALATGTGGFAWDPDPTAVETPLPAPEQAQVISLSPAEVLRDGRVVVRATIEGGEHDNRGQIDMFFILSDYGDRWLIDELVPVEFRGNSTDDLSTPTATATEPVHMANEPLYPEGSTIVIRSYDVPLRAAPATEAETIETITPPLVVVVTGPLVDSGGDLWYPIAYVTSGQTGYINTDPLIPPDHVYGSGGFVVGDVVVTHRQTRLREQPDAHSTTGPMLPPGARLRITGFSTSLDGPLKWWPVEDIDTGVTGYVLPDFISPDDTSATTTQSDFYCCTGPLNAIGGVGVGGSATGSTTSGTTSAPDDAQLPDDVPMPGDTAGGTSTGGTSIVPPVSPSSPTPSPQATAP